MAIELRTREWFKAVFDQNYEYIRNYLYYLSGDMDLSEDLVQDVFLKLWEKRESVRDETVKALLFKIGYHLFLRNKRDAGYDLKFKSTLINSLTHESPDYILELKELDKNLQRVIASMPEKCRTMFLLNRLDGLTYQQIALNLGVSVKAVEKQISKALGIITSKLGNQISRLV